jgi:hypothetical protein
LLPNSHVTPASHHPCSAASAAIPAPRYNPFPPFDKQLVGGGGAGTFPVLPH